MDYQSIILLIVGFSLIILIHEAGHFMAAKYVGIRVEQFALGFGQAIFSWRKGLGFRSGSSEKEYQRRQQEGTAEGIGETEYRWNWIPLGGYVKMMGQDDTKPGLTINDPRSYTSKTVGQRMLVISAGVIMNIIFAGIAFMVLFMVGLNVPTAVVGNVIPMAPAQFATKPDGTSAPLQVGDTLLSINGDPLYNDYRKIALDTALAKRGSTLAVEVKRVNGTVETVNVTPRQLGSGSTRFLGIGIEPSRLLEGPDLPTKKLKEQYATFPAEQRLVGPGERITQVMGQDVKANEYYKLDQALQQSNGAPVEITITAADGKSRQATIKPILMGFATGEGIAFAGMQPRPVVERVDESSSAHGKLQKGDIVVAISANGETSNYPTARIFTDRVIAAGKAGAKMTITVLRNGQEVPVPNLEANVYIDGLTRGLGIGVVSDLDHAVLSQPLSDSPAAAVPAGSAIRAVNGVEVAAWSDVLRELRKAEAGKPVTIAAIPPLAQAPQEYTLSLTPTDVTTLASMRYSTDLLLREMRDSRTTTNPLHAAWWGVTETRDSILQVYLTLSRLIEGSVPKTGVVGPVGMFQMGTQIASQGVDYLLWFLAIISANLAVVNFLPIPVVDGGHFLFLAIEKLRGRPVSERTMVVAQWCGLALIGFVFVFVTYQDILRIITVKM